VRGEKTGKKSSGDDKQERMGYKTLIKKIGGGGGNSARRGMESRVISEDGNKVLEGKCVQKLSRGG